LLKNTLKYGKFGKNAKQKIYAKHLHKMANFKNLAQKYASWQHCLLPQREVNFVSLLPCYCYAMRPISEKSARKFRNPPLRVMERN